MDSFKTYLAKAKKEIEDAYGDETADLRRGKSEPLSDLVFSENRLINTPNV